MKAAVLAAGEGTRLLPLTETRPKHLIPVAGKPLLDWLIESLRECSISEILLIVGRWKDTIAEHFGNGATYGVKTEYVIQPTVEGTAKAIHLAKEFAAGEPILVVYGDVLLSSDNLRNVIDTFDDSKPDAVMALTPVDRPEFFGVVETERGFVKRIVEKPEPAAISGNLANAGVYVFTDSIFEAIDSTPKSQRGEYEVTDSLRLMLERGRTIRSVEFDRFSWIDIGRPWDLLDANALALRKRGTRING